MSKLSALNSDILKYIIENNLQSGDRLPALTQLSAELQISVGKLREQLEVARSFNLVTVKPGAGIQVNDYNFASTIQPGLLFAVALYDHNFENYKALRNAVAASFWVEATALLTAEDVAELRALIASAWNKLNGRHIGIPHKEHRAFHLAIFRWLDNPFVMGIEQAYWNLYEAFELNRFADYQYLQAVWTYHQQMIDHVESGTFELSRNAFIEHTTLLKHR